MWRVSPGQAEARELLGRISYLYLGRSMADYCAAPALRRPQCSVRFWRRRHGQVPMPLRAPPSKSSHRQRLALPRATASSISFADRRHVRSAAALAAPAVHVVCPSPC